MHYFLSFSDTFAIFLGVLTCGTVGLARLLYHRPAFAVLDEATSAVNGDEQGRLHECLLEAGITLLSIAHRPEVRRFHQLELQLAGDGSGAWSLVPLEPPRPVDAWLGESEL